MKTKMFIFALTAMLAMVFSSHEPLFAAKHKEKRTRQEKTQKQSPSKDKQGKKTKKGRDVPLVETGIAASTIDHFALANTDPTTCDSIYANIPPNFQIVDYYTGPDCSGEPVTPFTPNSFPCQPPNQGGFNNDVWNGLWANTVEQLNGPADCPQLGLAGRLQCGRLGVRYFQNLNGCVPCPDELPCCEPTLAPTGATGCGSCEGIQVCSYCSGVKHPHKRSGDGCELKNVRRCSCNKLFGCKKEKRPKCKGVTNGCPSIPIRILALETYPITQLVCCSGCDGTEGQAVFQQQLLSSVSYNLDVINDAPTLGTRVVAVLAQAGYFDASGDLQIDQIDFANRQFGPTLDTLYGEKFAANILLPSDYINGILAQNPLNQTAAVQIVIYVEQGVGIQVLPLLETMQPAANGQPILAADMIDPLVGMSALPGAVLAGSSVSGANSQYFVTGGTQTLISAPGDYAVTPGSTVTLKGGGGGGGGGYIFFGIEPNGYGGGGGAEAFITTIIVPSGAAFLRVTAVGQGGPGGTGNSGPPQQTAGNGAAGTATSGYFLDSNKNMIPPVYSANGGNGGFGAADSTAGDGGSGGAGGGGGGRLTELPFSGKGGTGPLGIGQDGSDTAGGNGGDNGGMGGQNEFEVLYLAAGGGGGAGMPVPLSGSSSQAGAAGGPGGGPDMSANGFSWTNNILNNVLYGVGGGGGGGYKGNGGDGAPGYVLITAGM